jgi:hypothetical protein
MKQYEAVLLALIQLGGVATLGQLYEATLKIPDCHWGTKTPFESIRRILQTKQELFYRLEPGLWGLNEQRKQLQKIHKPESQHYHFQGIAVEIGNLEGFQTYVPPQDKNRRYLQQTLENLTTLEKIPEFTYSRLVQVCSSVDVIWFNERQMPARFLEIEHTTDMKNSLQKFVEFQDFHCEFFIVAPEVRYKEFAHKLKATVFRPIQSRVRFMGYEKLATYHTKLYEYKTEKSRSGF